MERIIRYTSRAQTSRACIQIPYRYSLITNLYESSRYQTKVSTTNRPHNRTYHQFYSIMYQVRCLCTSVSVSSPVRQGSGNPRARFRKPLRFRTPLNSGGSSACGVMTCHECGMVGYASGGIVWCEGCVVWYAGGAVCSPSYLFHYITPSCHGRTIHRRERAMAPSLHTPFQRTSRRSRTISPKAT